MLRGYCFHISLQRTVPSSSSCVLAAASALSIPEQQNLMSCHCLGHRMVSTKGNDGQAGMQEASHCTLWNKACSILGCNKSVQQIVYLGEVNAMSQRAGGSPEAVVRPGVDELLSLKLGSWGTQTDPVALLFCFSL